jgi:nicotinate dehydrogenase subunit B
MNESALDRRELLKRTGSGLFILFSVDASWLAAELQEPQRLPVRPSYPTDFNAYLRIGEDGRVTCLVGKVELGQGAMTALPQLLAEELDVALDTVDIVMGDTDLCPWDMGTFGSLTVRQFGPVLRAAGAEARGVLLELASERLVVPIEQLQVKAGAISSKARPDVRVTYGQLVHGARIERHLSKPAPLKPASSYQVVGRPAPRRDALQKVTGVAQYAGDLTLPGMLHARILRPPAHGARLTSLDTTAAAAVPGVRVVREGELIAVLHERRDVADRALALIKAEFERAEPACDDATVFNHIVKNSPPAQRVGATGDLQQGEKDAVDIVEATYLNAYVAHAPLETHSATAQMDKGRVTVWAGTQTPFSVKSQVAQALGLAADAVRVITPFVGGGFGGKSASRQAVEAARLARLTGQPIQVVWDRAEEFFYDTFRPAAVVKIRSGLTTARRIAFWDFDVYCAGDREAKQFYDVPHQRTVSRGGWRGDAGGPHPFAVGPWRAPSVNTNTFARESHIDTLAAKAKIDPVEFRLAHLSDQRLVRVLKTAATRFGWNPKPAPSGRGVGVALATYLGTYVATVAEVAVDKDGHVRVVRIVCAQEMGVVVNPEGARQQMEGSITMGLGYALTEEVHFKGGEILERNFDTYSIPRFSWLPKIETILIDVPDQPSQGCGEPPIVGMGAVLANAVFDATGARLYHLPMTPARVKAAIASLSATNHR